MKKYIYDATRKVRIDDDTPQCGKDFCGSCGDCLSCHWEDACYGTISGVHFWVVYVEDEYVD